MCTRKRCVVCLLLTAVLLAGTILPAFAYDDVPSAAWYAGTVREITERGWMNGLGNGSFAPESSMTRAMFVTVLHRAVGTPDGGAIPFTDVPDGAYYEAAVAWAAGTGVVQGVSETLFGPDRSVTREQAVAMLYRYLCPKAGNGSLAAYDDAASVSAFARDAMAWAVSAGVMQGDGSMLRPGDTVTRAEAAALLLRALPEQPAPEAHPSTGSGAQTPLPKPEPEPEPEPEPLPEPVTVFDPAAVMENGATVASNGSRTVVLVEPSDEEFGAMLQEQGLEAALLSRGVGQVLCQITMQDANAVDLSQVKDGFVLRLPVWNGGSGNVTVFLELGSEAAIDTAEHQYSNLTLAPGWNVLELAYSAGSGAGTPIDWSHVVRLRMFSSNVSEPADFLIGDLTFYAPQTLPGNTTGDPALDVQCAANAVNAGIAADLEDGVLCLRVPNGTPWSEREARILALAESYVTAWLKGADNVYNVTHEIACTPLACTILLRCGTAKQTVTFPVRVEFYQKSAPRQVSSVYAPDEVILADIVIGEGEYTLPQAESGLPDATAVIQTALNDCGSEGGGTVWLPKGFYRITGMLDVPAFVTLRGDWQDPDAVSDKSALEYGTILVADMDADSETPLINISGSCGVMGVTIYYPRQTLSQVQPYRYALNNEGRGIRRADRYMHTYLNCTIINGFDGLGFCTGVLSEQTAGTAAEQSLVRNVKGTFLGTAFYNYNSSDNGGVTGFTANASYWCDFLESPAYQALLDAGVTPAQTSVTREAIVAYTKANSTGMMLGDLEGDYFSNVTIDGYRNGLLVRQGLRTTFYGDFYRLNVSNCENGAVFETLSGFGVNIACSSFTGNTIDLVTNSRAPIHLVDVAYSTTGGSHPESFQQTSDTGLTDPMLDGAGHAGMTSGGSVILDDLDRTGSSDVSAAVQQALNSLTSTGGVVYLPAGHYRLDSALSVPAGVELRGSSPVGVKPAMENDGGTVLEVRFQSGAGEAAIQLCGKGAGISGLMLTAADQTVWEETAYIDTGYAVRGQDAPGAFVQNCAIVAFSKGIYMERCNGYVIEGMNFTCYETNVAAKDCVGGSISRCLQNAGQMVNNSWGYPGWNFTITTNSPYFTITSNQLDCILLDGCTGQSVQHWFAYRPHNTLTLQNGSEAVMVNTGAGGLAGENVGSMAIVDGTSKLLSINNHQKNRYSVQAAPGAEVAAFNRLTLIVATIMPRQGSYWSSTEHETLLLDGKDGLYGTLTVDGYALSGGGTVTCDAGSYAGFGDVYDLSAHAALAVELTTDAGTDGGALLVELNGHKAYFDVEGGGRQTVYLPINAFGTAQELSQTTRATLSVCVDNSVQTCTLHSLRAVKVLPDSASLTFCTPVGPTFKRLISAGNATLTSGSVLPKSDPEAQALPAEYAGLQTDSLWKAQDAVRLLQANFKAVDLSRYHEDGYLHFFLYLPETALNVEYHLELSSAGVSDSQELEFFFGPGSSYYNITFQAGWNEIFLPLYGAAATGRMDFSAVNFLRLYQTTSSTPIGQIYVDGFDVVHRENLPDGAIPARDDKPVFENFAGLTPLGTNSSIQTVDLSGETYGRSGTGWFVTANIDGTAQIIRHTANDPQNWARVADYAGDGYIHIGLFIPNETSLTKFGNLTIELTSSGTWDVREMQWGCANTRLQAGWNDLYLPLTQAHETIASTVANASYCDLNALRTIRVYTTNTQSGAASVWGDLYATLTVPVASEGVNIVILETR